MLKITTQADEAHLVLIVEGRLVSPWVEELEACWKHAKIEAGKTLVVDLRSVTFAGIEGKELLGRIYRSGAELITSGFMMDSFVEQLKSEKARKADQ